MYRINHNDAVTLEHQVSRLYKCDRAGIVGMCDADYFEGHPFHAAVLVVAYIYAEKLDTNIEENKLEDFLNTYEAVFDNPEEYDMNSEIQSFISKLA